MSEELWEQVIYGRHCVHGTPVGTPGGADLMCGLCEDGLDRWVDDTWTEYRVWSAVLNTATGKVSEPGLLRSGMDCRVSLDEWAFWDDLGRRGMEHDGTILLIGTQKIRQGEWVCPTCDDRKEPCSYHAGEYMGRQHA
jgi:hypothetical protein